ncbi:ATP-binding protein [Streptomyces albus]|nr:ATP-binding protein [Streptomyces albus]
MTGEEPALPAVRLHGRAPQLSRVRAWWHQPAAHRTALLVVSEPGLGRTAVLRWAARVLGAGSVGHLVAGPDARPRHQEWTPGPCCAPWRAARAGSRPCCARTTPTSGRGPTGGSCARRPSGCPRRAVASCSPPPPTGPCPGNWPPCPSSTWTRWCPRRPQPCWRRR